MIIAVAALIVEAAQKLHLGKIPSRFHSHQQESLFCFQK